MANEDLKTLISEGFKNLSTDQAFYLSNSKFPKLTSLAKRGDRFAMKKLNAHFSRLMRTNEDFQKSFLCGALSTFWENKEIHTKGFECPNCGSTNTVTPFEEYPPDEFYNYYIRKGDSFCVNCKYEWLEELI